MFKKIKNVKVIKNVRINVLTGQALSNTVKKARKKYKKDLKRKFLS